MVALQFLNLVGKLHLTTYVGMEDFADKLNFLFTVAILILSMMVVTIKSYFLKPITCFLSGSSGGNSFDNYVDDYCWIHGMFTYSLKIEFPYNRENMKELDNVESKSKL